MNSTQTFALSALIALLLTSGLSQARDWRWYPRKTPRDTGALRPDLEGTRDDDPEQREMSELEELRQWLQQRDDDRRRQGITVPDTVEQLAPAGVVATPRRQWPESATRHPADDQSPDAVMDEERLLDEESEHIRETLLPHFYGKQTTQPPRRTWQHQSSPPWRRIFRHPTSGANRKGSTSRRRH